MVDPAQLQGHADRIRASNVLGRSGLMQRLFDFFVECSLAGKVPKEIEVAIDVFGKDARFEVTQDAMVRVYIHKLRRKLEEYYAGPGRQENGRLVIPKGEYRFVFEASPLLPAPVEPEAEPEPGLPDEPAPLQRNTRKYWLAAGVALLLMANVCAWLLTRPTVSPSMQEIAQVRANPVWADMLDDNLPIYVVIGDYYIFGELDDSSMNVQRLVREFDINSRNDLEQFLKNNPQLADRYMDVSLQYLPISSAYALHNVIPLLEPNNKSPRQVQFILASDLTPGMIKSSHIVYIGLLSGMGILRELAFTGSQFKIGDSYDELIDRHTNQRYVSQAGIVVDERTKYRDYGYFSTFSGPGGNRIVILAGTRDVALMHTAEALTHTQPLMQVEKQAGVSENFEALYSVEAIDRMNLDGRLVLTGKLDTTGMWVGGVVSENPSASQNETDRPASGPSAK